MPENKTKKNRNKYETKIFIKQTFQRKFISSTGGWMNIPLPTLNLCEKSFFYTFLVFISESEKLRNQQHIVREGTKINKINIYNFWKDH